MKRGRISHGENWIVGDYFSALRRRDSRAQRIPHALAAGAHWVGGWQNSDLRLGVLLDLRNGVHNTTNKPN